MAFNAGDIVGTLTLDRDPFQRGLAQARRDAEEFERRKITATVEADTAGAKRDLDSIRDVKVKADTSEAQRELGSLPREHDVDVKVHVEQARRQIDAVLRSIGSVKVAAGASIVALVPAAVAASAAVGGIGVAALATIPAFGALGAAMAMHFKRGGATVEALKHEVGHLRGAFENATGPATRAAFGGLTEAIRGITPIVRNMRSEFTGLGEMAGMAFAALGEHLQSDRMTRFFDTMLRGARRSIAPLTGIVTNLLSVLANITEAAMPMFIRGLERVSEYLGRMVRHTNDIGRLRDGLRSGAEAAGQFWQIARNLGSILASVWTAAQQPSADFLASIERGTRHLAAFFRSAEGQEILRKTLESMVFFAEELMRSLPTLIRMFGTILDVGRRLWIIVTGILDVIEKIPVVGPTLAAVGLAFAAWMGPIGLVRGALRGVIGLLGTIRRSRVPSPVGGVAGGRGGAGGATPIVAPINTGRANRDAQRAGTTAGRGFGVAFAASVAAARNRIGSVVRGLTRFAGGALSRIPGLARIGTVVAGGFAAASPRVRAVVSRIGPMAGGVLRAGGSIVARGVFGWPGLIASVIYSMLPGRMRDAVNRAVSSAFNAFVSGGRSLAIGLANGIASGASAVFNAAISVARSAWNAAKSFLGIRSPSRKFAELGEHISEGLAVGIRNKIGIAARMARAAAIQARDAARAELKRMDAEDAARQGPAPSRADREGDIFRRISEARYASDERGLLNNPPPGVQRLPSAEERELQAELEALRREFQREDLEAAANVNIQAMTPSDPRVLREIQRSVGRSVRQGRRRRPRRVRMA